MTIETMAEKLKNRFNNTVYLVKVHCVTKDTAFDQVFDLNSTHGRQLLLRAVVGTMKRHGTVTITEYRD